MAVSLAEVKAYMRVEGNADDAEISALIRAAEQYIEGAVGTVNKENPVYIQIVKALTLHYYDNRGVVVTSTLVTDIPFGLRSMMNQLRYT